MYLPLCGYEAGWHVVLMGYQPGPLPGPHPWW